MAQLIALVDGTAIRRTDSPLQFPGCRRLPGSAAGMLQWSLSGDRTIRASAPGGGLQEWTLHGDTPARIYQSDPRLCDLDILHHGYAIFALPGDPQTYAIEQENWASFVAGTDAALLCVSDATWDLVPRLPRAAAPSLLVTLFGGGVYDDGFGVATDYNQYGTVPTPSLAYPATTTQVGRPLTLGQSLPNLSQQRVAIASGGQVLAIAPDGTLWCVSAAGGPPGTPVTLPSLYSPLPGNSLLTIVQGVSWSAGTWWLLVSYSSYTLSLFGDYLIHGRLVVVLSSTASAPTSGGDWSTYCTLANESSPPGDGWHWFYGVGAGGTVLEINQDNPDTSGIALWTAGTRINIGPDDGTTHGVSITGLAAGYTNVAFNGDAPAPILVNGAILTVDGSLGEFNPDGASGWAGACNGAGTEAYGISTLGNLYSGVTTTFTLVASGVIPAGDTILLFQHDRTTPGSFIVVHGTGATVTVTRLDASGLPTDLSTAAFPVRVLLDNTGSVAETTFTTAAV